MSAPPSPERHHRHFIADFDADGDHDWRRLGVEDFERIFDLPVPPDAAAAIAAHDLRHRPLTADERDRQILKTLRILDEPLVVSGPKRQEAWEKGWDQNLQDYIDGGFREEDLLPYYYRRGRTVMRLRDDYVLPRSERFEALFLDVLQRIIAGAYFRDVPAVYEYGCGPGHNLLAFGRITPGKTYCGYDWASPSQRILELADARSVKADADNRFIGGFVDLFDPRPPHETTPGAAVLTFGSMEQLGDRFGPLFEHFRRQPASIFVHIEPFSEFRNPDLLLDELAERYARKRGYLNGYLDCLRRREEAGELEILKERKLLGSSFYDGWCLVVWRPTEKAAAALRSPA